MPSAVALHMVTFAFILADVAFSFSSVLTIDEGNVLAVQKECCVLFVCCWAAAAENIAVSHSECHPQPDSGPSEQCISEMWGYISLEQVHCCFVLATGL